MANAKLGITRSAQAELIDRLRLCADKLSRYDYEGIFTLIQSVPSVAGQVIDSASLRAMWDAVNEADTKLAAAQEANEAFEDALNILAGVIEG
jgi:hypothetical protein